MSGILVLILRLGLAACLYAFLGWALFHLWKDLRTQGLSLAGRKAPVLSLTIQRAGGETTHRAFQQSDISIGRDSACDIPLNDDAISVRHVHLSYHHGQWWVEDLGSTNGTRLNQAPLSTPTVITTGDQVECGHTAIIISIGATATPSPTLRL
jgi:pSer/pThr/pTyr-binding forkhead associated (FHA) protein